MITKCNDRIEEVKKDIHNVLTQWYSKLDALLKGCLQQIVTDMFSAGLVTQTTKKEPNVEKVMSDFMTGMEFITDCQELVEYCKLFLCTLDQQGGPFKRAANKIAEEWTTNVKKRELNVNLQFNIG